MLNTIHTSRTPRDIYATRYVVFRLSSHYYVNSHATPFVEKGDAAKIWRRDAAQRKDARCSSGVPEAYAAARLRDYRLPLLRH